VLTHATEHFADPPEADRWLAPRVHAALRVTRREAADKSLWGYLGVVRFENYVRWRFKDAPASRFIGPPHDQAIGRLWWGAELLRNGAAYDDVVTGFRIQDIPNSFRFDIFHRRPLALAAVRVLGTWRDGEPATGRQANRLLQAMNMEIVTLAVDAELPDEALDDDESWLEQTPRTEDLLDETLPEGPSDSPVREETLRRAIELVHSIATDIALSK
jgi:hypothetical protein